MADKLTDEQARRLALVDRSGKFTDEDSILLPGLHFCPDWDFAAICDDSAEHETCACTDRRSALTEGRKNE